MEVILLSDQRNLGRRGEVVKVKPGYARNFLLPQGLALAVTAANLKQVAAQRKKFDAVHAKERDAAQVVASQLAGLKLTVAKRVGETQTLYGSVTATEVAELLAAKGVTVDRRKIDLPEHGIKTLGDHTVTIDLHAEVKADVTVTVVPEE
ncbi:MAG TPA: 50S ribosomal protein L9 [Thermoanaerobaculia bacterium]|nr:50S ribosomal protein L9 [Thermoanaerobaculia bacterium]